MKNGISISLKKNFREKCFTPLQPYYQLHVRNFIDDLLVQFLLFIGLNSVRQTNLVLQVTVFWILAKMIEDILIITPSSWVTVSSKRVYCCLLTLSWQRPLSYWNQSIDFLCKSMDWFLYDNGLRHERVKYFQFANLSSVVVILGAFHDRSSSLLIS